MAIRVRCVSILCIGSLLVPMAQANTGKLPKKFSVARKLMRAATSAASGSIDQTLMGIINQVAYEKTPSQVIDELVYAYGDQSSDPLPGIAQLLSQQSTYLGMALEAAQCIVNVLPPASPHIVAVKLVINELSVCNASLQTILSAIPQNSQSTSSAAPAVAATNPSAPGAAPVVNAAPVQTTAAAPVSNQAFESAVMTLVTDAASAVQAIATSTSSASSSTSHHHGSSTNK